MGLNWLPNNALNGLKLATQCMGFNLAKNNSMGFKKKKKISWARFGPNRLNGARGARRGESRPRKKNPINIQAGFGLRVLARGSGPGMQKPGPNPTRCHP